MPKKNNYIKQGRFGYIVIVWIKQRPQVKFNFYTFLIFTFVSKNVQNYLFFEKKNK